MVTVNAGTLTTRMAHLLESAYTAAGIDPSLVVVTQGSYHHGSQSGSTHDGGGAADLRVWNLPSGESANLYGDLVTRLRERNACAWYRDQSHGGMDPHIHLIVRDEPKLSSGAKSQVSDYDAGRNGLSNKGADYHPRPVQHPIEWWDSKGEDDDMPLSDSDINKIAAAVWGRILTDPILNDSPTAATLVQRVRRDTDFTGMDKVVWGRALTDPLINDRPTAATMLQRVRKDTGLWADEDTPTDDDVPDTP